MNNGQSARTFAPEVSGCLTDPSLQSLESLPRRILAIDDSPNYLAVLLKELRNHGYEVVGAGSGTEGLTRLGNERFDCALVDLAMPEMDGIEVCRRMAAMRQTQEQGAS